jgi:hypothetical protein
LSISNQKHIFSGKTDEYGLRSCKKDCNLDQRKEKKAEPKLPYPPIFEAARCAILGQITNYIQSNIHILCIASINERMFEILRLLIFIQWKKLIWGSESLTISPKLSEKIIAQSDKCFKPLFRLNQSYWIKQMMEMNFHMIFFKK